MNKVLVNIMLPKLELNYDVFLPINKSLYQVTKAIIESVNELNGEVLDTKGDYTLILKDTNMLLDGTKTVKQNNLKNGSTIILI